MCSIFPIVSRFIQRVKVWSWHTTRRDELHPTSGLAPKASLVSSHSSRSSLIRVSANLMVMFQGELDNVGSLAMIVGLHSAPLIQDLGKRLRISISIYPSNRENVALLNPGLGGNLQVKAIPLHSTAIRSAKHTGAGRRGATRSKCSLVPRGSTSLMASKKRYVKRILVNSSPDVY